MVFIVVGAGPSNSSDRGEIARCTPPQRTRRITSLSCCARNSIHQLRQRARHGSTRATGGSEEQQRVHARLQRWETMGKPSQGPVPNRSDRWTLLVCSRCTSTSEVFCSSLMAADLPLACLITATTTAAALSVGTPRGVLPHPINLRNDLPHGTQRSPVTPPSTHLFSNAAYISTLQHTGSGRIYPSFPVSSQPFPRLSPHHLGVGTQTMCRDSLA